LAIGDRPVVAAAYAARGLGIAYNHPLAVEACRSKLRMREIFRDAGLRTPWFRKVAIHPAPEPALLGITYPGVLKPLSLSASQGVIRANNREEFRACGIANSKAAQFAELQATREPNLGHMIVEGYIPGEEVAVEGLLTNGGLRVLAIFDKPNPLTVPTLRKRFTSRLRGIHCRCRRRSSGACRALCRRWDFTRAGARGIPAE